MDIVQRIAQLESEQIGERVKIGMTKKAQLGQGSMGSGHPYGYEYTPAGLATVQSEAEVVRKIFSMRREGKSTERIAVLLNNAFIPAKKGGMWNRQSVWRILRNPLYVGYMEWDGIVRTGTQEALVSRKTFEEINGPMERPET